MFFTNKKGYLSFFLLFFCVATFAQKNEKFVPYSELGITGGVTYYNGELNPNKQFPIGFMKPAFGVSYRRNISKRYTLRATGIYGNLFADERLTPDAFSAIRGASFKTMLVELSGTVEFNFFQFEVGHRKHFSSPYLFVGGSGYYINPKVSVNGIAPAEEINMSPVQFAIPMGIGYKASIGKRLSLSLECGWRKTYTDHIDGISKVYPGFDTLTVANAIIGKQRGNSKNKDWYVFSGATLAFSIYDKDALCPAYDKKRSVKRWIEDKVY